MKFVRQGRGHSVLQCNVFEIEYNEVELYVDFDCDNVVGRGWAGGRVVVWWWVVVVDGGGCEVRLSVGSGGCCVPH